jgi:hypothetical protein
MADRPNPPYLPINLTERQAHLYRNHPTFKSSVDYFMNHVVSLYLDGLTELAESIDRKYEVLMRQMREANIGANLPAGFLDEARLRSEVDALIEEDSDG